MLALWLAALAVGAAGCGEAEQAAESMSVRPFDYVHVVSAFPALVDPQTGSSVRVCGAPLPGEPAKSANGLEFVVELVSVVPARTSQSCTGDQDLGFAEGDHVDSSVLSTKASQGATVAPAMFTLHVACLQPWTKASDSAACATSSFDSKLTANAVRYDRVSPHCDPIKTNSWKNVVILVDHSGSTSGQVAIDSESCLDAKHYAEDRPDAVKAPGQFGQCGSDKYFLRVQAAQRLIDELNPQDRVMTLLFNELQGVHVGCTDTMRCRNENAPPGRFEVPAAPKMCRADEDCDWKGGYRCVATLAPGQSDGFDMVEPALAMAKCFGSTTEKRAMNHYGIDARGRYNGVGRAPVYEAVHTAFAFLNSTIAAPDPVAGGNAKHIVLIADGPDTCMPSDDFHFADPKAQFAGKLGECRSPCTASSVTYQALRAEMAAAQWPVQIHVIQLQSPGHREPNAELMELACRSGGTYQFVNQLDLAQDDDDNFYRALGKAVGGVRQALNGTWRAGFVVPTSAANGPNLPMGQLQAMAGELRFENPMFTSLAGVYEPPFGAVAWRPLFQFGPGTAADMRDDRLMLRAACATDSDCGASDPCAPNHCTPGGLCQPKAAPDLLPCGDSKVCCQGVCASDCPGACK
ncbi:MAG: hypothetical protein HY902_04225 [Deltaproteobacteria bacterium]|nr:hypothetical protein [Deltaproteobacteria bacterium]